MKRTVHITIVPDGDGFVAECAELHAVTQGDTLEATIADEARPIWGSWPTPR